MEGRELRRSYTQMEFPVTKNRHHHYQHSHGKSSSKKFAVAKKAPAMELYKPPNQRDSQGGASSKLNVHAKEFSPLQSSKSMGTAVNQIGESKMKNSHDKSNHQHFASRIAKDHEAIKNLYKSKSTSNALQTLNATSGLVEMFEGTSEKMLLMKGMTDFKSLSCLDRIDTLPKMIVGKALKARANAQSCALLCHTYMNRDPEGMFSEGLINICQYTLQTKCMVENTSRYHAFMAFLNELYSVIKPGILNELEGISSESPSRIILRLIVQVCQNILQQKKLGSAEIECLFFTVTSIGRDLDNDDPKLLDGLSNHVRDAFIRPSTPESIRKTLMQLLELRAAKWNLPLSAFVYYSNNLS